MKLRFREDKATQVASKLLKLDGGRMNVMKLVKLMYLSDRTAMVRWGKPITMDSLYSLPYGPILSSSLNLMNLSRDAEEPRYWHRYVSERHQDDVDLLQPPVNDQLSRNEEQVVNEVFRDFGRMTQFQLSEYTHGLPEWKNPGKGRLPIDLRDILLDADRTEEQIRAIKAHLEYVTKVSAALA